MPEDFILAGDINFHLKTCDYQVEALRKLWSSFNFVQHVDMPTHKLGHTLDLVLTRCDSVEIRNLVAKQKQISWSLMRHGLIRSTSSSEEKEEKQRRNIKELNLQ